jgi:hypothetical protein
MGWDWHDTLHILHHLPHAHHDLLHHEDKKLVQAGVPGLIRKDAGPPPLIGIEKNIDPGISRTEHNLGLLVRDYLHTLPDYIPETEEGEALMRHWRKILMDQPQRLAEMHMDSWNSERSRQFWRERLKHYAEDPSHYHGVIDDWERSAGAEGTPPANLGLVKSRQWHDLVIRQRLHKADLDLMGVKERF